MELRKQRQFSVVIRTAILVTFTLNCSYGRNETSRLGTNDPASTLGGSDEMLTTLGRKLTDLGYGSNGTAPNDQTAFAKMMENFAERHFEGRTLESATPKLLLKHLEEATTPFKLNSKPEPASLLCRYRLGVCEFGHLRYVIGGGRATMSSEQVAKIRKFITETLAGIPPGKEILLAVAEPFDGLRTDLIVTAESLSADPKEFISRRANEVPMSGRITLTQNCETEDGILLDVGNRTVLIAAHFPKGNEAYQSAEFRVTDATQISASHRRGAEQALAFKDLQSSFVPFERIKFSSERGECSRIQVHRPSTESADLIQAVSDGDTAVVQKLLKNGADVNTTNASGFTALHLAAGNGWEEIVKLLLRYKANPNAQLPSGETPLFYSVMKCWPGTWESLANSGANLNATNRDG